MRPCVWRDPRRVQWCERRSDCRAQSSTFARWRLVTKIRGVCARKDRGDSPRIFGFAFLGWFLFQPLPFFRLPAPVPAPANHRSHSSPRAKQPPGNCKSGDCSTRVHGVQQVTGVPTADQQLIANGHCGHAWWGASPRITTVGEGVAGEAAVFRRMGLQSAG